MAEEESSKKTHGFLRFICILVVMAGVVFAIIGIAVFVTSQQGGTTSGNNDGGSKLLYRSARNSDVILNTELDFGNLGEKIVISPQTDIDGLELTIEFYDGNKKFLYSLVKKIGNVKRGVQISCSISILEMQVAPWEVDSLRVGVTGGTVSIFS